MTRTSLKDWDCSLARTLEVIGDKWTMMILRNAFFGTHTFSGFQRELGIARNILSSRLQRLVEAGVLRRTIPSGGGHPDYKLTQAGRELHTVLVAMLQWGDRHVPPPGGPPYGLVERESGAPIAPLHLHGENGAPLTLFDVAFERRRGS